MFSFLVDVAIEMCEKAYLATIQNITANYIDEKLKQLTLYIDKFLYDGEKEESVDESSVVSEDLSDHEIVVTVGGNDVSFDEDEVQYKLKEEYVYCSESEEEN